MYCHKTTWKVEQVRIFFSSGANNLIPMEIALKIADKIRAHERFAAYIVIPMWPEGNPTGAATQRILFWQVKRIYALEIFIHENCYDLYSCLQELIPFFFSFSFSFCILSVYNPIFTQERTFLESSVVASSLFLKIRFNVSSQQRVTS